MKRIEVVLIGTSLGGLKALETVLPGIPDGFFLPIVIVQHRQAESEERLVPILQRYTRLKVMEVKDKEKVTSGNVYLAPSNYHILLEPGFLGLSTEAPVCHSRPSIDVLFESAVNSYGARALAVILTGASSDGAKGAAEIAEAGGTVLVQEPETAESALMPMAAICSVPTAIVRPLAEIASCIVQFCAESDVV